MDMLYKKDETEKPKEVKKAPVKKVEKAKTLDDMISGGSAAMYEFSASIANASWKVERTTKVSVFKLFL